MVEPFVNTALSASKPSICSYLTFMEDKASVIIVCNYSKQGEYWLEDLFTPHYAIATHWGVAYIIVTTLWCSYTGHVGHKATKKLLQVLFHCRAQNILVLFLSPLVGAFKSIPLHSACSSACTYWGNLINNCLPLVALSPGPSPDEGRGDKAILLVDVCNF